MRKDVIKLLSKRWIRDGNLFHRIVNGRRETINLSAHKLILTAIVGSIPVTILKVTYTTLEIKGDYLIAISDGKTRYVCRIGGEDAANN